MSAQVMSTTKKCSRCQCNKLLKFFKVRENTGMIYKTCIQCCEKYKCDFENCEYTCDANCNMVLHKKNIHDAFKDFHCNLCQMAFTEECFLQLHKDSIHI